MRVWIQVGKGSVYISFNTLKEALNYLNSLQVGKVTQWCHLGFKTLNYRGDDYIRIFHGSFMEFSVEERILLEMGLFT